MYTRSFVFFFVDDSAVAKTIFFLSNLHWYCGRVIFALIAANVCLLHSYLAIRPSSTKQTLATTSYAILKSKPRNYQNSGEMAERILNTINRPSLLFERQCEQQKHWEQQQQLANTPATYQQSHTHMQIFA